MPLTFRTELTPDDRVRIRAMVESTGVFNAVELDCAVELADERLEDGPPSGYFFLFAELDGRVVGYACYGPIALTVGSYDLFWIAVDKSAQGMGLGRKIMDKVAEIIRSEGGRNIYIETSTRPHYQPTRAFYERCGCALVATFDDFYAPGDGKAIYCKRVL
jgi:ribosomal protein S18 acetylase RimI-like enzyme